MRTLARTAVALSFIGATAIGTTTAVQAQYGYYPHPYYYHHYYRHYPRYGYYGGGYPTWNGCPPQWTIQGGVCKPYRFGPWDRYNYGYGYWR